MGFLVVAVFVALGCAAWTASIAEGKGRNPVPWGFLGLFTGVIGVIVAACVRPTDARPASTAEGLARLVELHDAGKLTDEEFAAAKRQALGL